MSERRRRPTRACTVRSIPAAASGSSEVNRARTQASQVVASPQEEQPQQPSSADPEELRKLRSMWELASVINFFDTFWPVLKLDKKLTAQQLEIALLYPSVLLVDVHIGLLKGLSPPMRTSVNRETWTTVLYKKLKDRWPLVSDAPFPLAGSHGRETEAYKEIDIASRLAILKALCECRLDQDDIRLFMEASGKKDASAFRKERCGTDSHGTTYWYEDGPVSGYRLYKEYREIRKLTEKDARGSAALSPPGGEWETLASSLDEFRAVADNLSNSRNRQELALAKRLFSNTIPILEELQKKKERILKRQQRQALLLDSSLVQENGHTGGRALRDRKQVKYTFDEFERSITEAIKYTKKQPESTPKSNGGTPLANGHVKATRSKHKEPAGQRNERSEVEHDYSDGRSSGSDDGEPLEAAGPVPSGDTEEDSSPRRRKRFRSNVHKEYAYDEDEEDIYSDDEIEGEAIYDEEFIRRRKRKKVYASSPEYKQEEDEAMGEGGDAAGTDSDSYKGEDEDDDDYNEEDETKPVQKWTSRGRPLRQVRQLKLLETKSGLRRSQRNIRRRRVNYRAEESEVEEDEEQQEEDEDEPPPVRRRQEKEALSGSSSIEDRDSESSGRDHRQEQENGEEQGDELGSMRDEDGDVDEEEEEEQVEQGPAVAEEARRERRFLDLNECAPSESPRDHRGATESDEVTTMLLF